MQYSTREVLDTFIDQEGIHNFEGRRGVVNLCRLVRALGYKDPYHQMQLSEKASIGDLIMFLEDNPGAMEAIVNWVADLDNPDFTERLLEETVMPDDEEPIDDEEDE